MRERTLISSFVALGLLAAFTGSIVGMLIDEAGWSHELGLLLSGLGFAGTLAFLNTRPWAESSVPLVAHPTVLLACFAGWGLPVLAVLLFLVTAQRVEAARRPVSVPALGVALLLCVLAIPRFEVVALAFASPLFFIAPKVMLERHMLSFYLVALFPAVMAMILGALIFGLPERPDPAGTELVSAALPASLVPLILSLLLCGKGAWRISALTSVVCLGFLLAPGMSPVFAALIVALAASFLVRGRVPLGWEAAVAAIGTLAAMFSASQVPGL